MTAYNDADESDAWRDDESMTSADDFSVNTADLDSDFEFLSRSSSHALTEEETDTDDLNSLPPTDASIITGVASEGTESPDLDLTETAERVLSSTDLAQMMSDSHVMQDSTSTVMQTPRPRRSTVTVTPSLSDTHDSHGLPFYILYAGSSAMKSNVLRKLAQSLMASILQSRAGGSQVINTEWASGYTSVVPITDFTASNSVPEVEFVEDSVVKLRVQEIESLYGYKGVRDAHFMCSIETSNVVSCDHRHPRKVVCPWLATPGSCPSLVVYCSPVRGEESNINMRTIEQFAQTHYLPLLVISEDSPKKRYACTWPGILLDDKATENDIVELDRKKAMEIEPISLATFFDLDSTRLGTSLWALAKWSQHKRKSPIRKGICKLDWQKRVLFRIVATIVVLFIVVYSRRTSTNPPPPLELYPVATIPTQKELETKYVAASEIMSIPPSTVTVTEQLTVTVPVIHTKTVTTSSTPRVQRKPASTVILQEITSSINIPRASLSPRLPEVDYEYAFAYDDSNVQMFLETEISVLLRLPGVYRDSLHTRPRVRISVTRDSGEPVAFELRQWKKNDLLFINWDPRNIGDRLVVRVWTESTPVFNKKFILDYREPLIDPKLWELLGKSQTEARRRLTKLQGALDEKLKDFAKEITNRVSDPSKYAEERLGGAMQMAKKLRSEVLEATERRWEELRNHYGRLFNPGSSEAEIERFNGYAKHMQQWMDGYVRSARKEAALISNKLKQFAKTERKGWRNGKGRWSFGKDKRRGGGMSWRRSGRA